MSLGQTLQTEIADKIWQAPIQSVNNEQIVELLDNLGFIDIDINNSFTLSLNEQENALFRLESELSQSRITVEKAINSQLPDEPQDIDKLSQLVDIDGSFELSNYSVEEITEDPVLTRILNYRLYILGLTTSHQGNVFTKLSQEALSWLAQLFSLSISAVIALTNDVESVFKLFVDQGQFSHTEYIGLLYFNNPVDSKVELRYRNSRKKFLSQFPDFGGEFSDEQKSIIRRTNFRRPSSTVPVSKPLSPQIKQKVEALANTQLNAFGLRLVQIKLFLLGTYAGKLDSNMGPLGLQSILDFKNMENHEDEKHIDEKEFVFRLSNEWWAFNLHYFLNRQQDEDNVQDNIGIAAKLESLSASLNSEDKPRFYQELNQLVEKEHSDERLKPKRVKKSRSLFRSLAKFFRKVGKTIKKGIKAVIKAIKKLFNWIKNGVRMLLLEIKSAVQSLRKAIVFVFGKRIIRTQNITTDFDQDFDVVSRLPNGIIEGDITTNKALQSHIQKLLSLRQNLTQTTNLLNNTLPIIIHLLTPPIGWLKAGVTLAKLLLKHPLNDVSFA